MYVKNNTPLALLMSLVVLSSCHMFDETKNKSNRTLNHPKTNRVLEYNGVKLQVLSESEFKKETRKDSLVSASDPRALRVLNNLPLHRGAPSIHKNQKDFTNNTESLLVGFPMGLVGEENVFGGVIIKVSDKENENLGTLKLTELPPLHVKTAVSFVEKFKPVLTLMGCFSECTEESELQSLISFPIKGLDLDTGMIIIDLASIGKELNLMALLDPEGEYTKLKSISSETVSVDFDMKTLLFDVQIKMIPLTSDPKDPGVKTTDFTVRWYLKLSSGFNSAFKARVPVNGVGFFTTERSLQPKINRFSITDSAVTENPVHYYIKNVPLEFRPSFIKALESWNKEFKSIIGKKLLSYEFIEPEDEELQNLTPGDIRYNIIEWDLLNKAGYGGLGPSVSNQFSGQIFSANVLIQGPTIVKIYQEWFGVSERARILLAEGRNHEANRLIKQFETSVEKEILEKRKGSFKLKLGQYLEMNIPAQRKELEDPIKKGHFEIVPEGISYEEYMKGYMTEILAHEIGHNLGLRHNFKGNLGAIDSQSEPGAVSRSVMEYLGRPYRHLNVIGAYDKMALAYGYKGVAPKHLNWYCTDEDQGTDAKTLPLKSPECSKSDATSDPFSFWESRLDRILDLMIERKSTSAPVWKVPEIKTVLHETITGLSAYALSAESTAESWTNFFGKHDRPEDKSLVKSYVLQRIKKKLCDPLLEEVILQKETPLAIKTAQDNLSELKADIVKKTKDFGLYKEEDFGCPEAP